MHWRFIAIGKPRATYATLGIEEYLARLKHYANIETLYLKSEAALLYKSKDSLRLVLDERGHSWTSRELSHQVASWEQTNVKQVSVLIGGAEGHSPKVLQAHDALHWSLSPLTLPHEMALMVALEQVYRAYTIKAGLPYHKD